MRESIQALAWRPASPSQRGMEDGENKENKEVSVYVVDSTVAAEVGPGKAVVDSKPHEEDDLRQWQQIMGALTVSWLNFVVGYSTGFVSPAIASMNSEDSDFRVTENEISWIGSLMPLFALVGSSIGGLSLDRIGRKWTIILGGTPFVPSFFLTYIADEIWMVMVGRALSGVAIGLSTVSVPVYLGELTGPKVRGFYGLLPTTSGNLGILVATLLGLPLEWRTMSLVGFIANAPFFVLIFFLVESPVWQLAMKMRKNKLDRIIVPDKKHSTTSGVLNKEETIFRREYMLPFFICLGMHIVQQFCGINAVITYATQIFQGVNSTIDPLLSTVIVSVVNVLSTLLATFLVDRIGRKRLMYVSLVMLLGSNMALSAYYYSVTVGHGWTLLYDWVPLAALATFILGFSLGAGPIPWLILGEILPAKIRGTTASIVTAAHWVFTFAVTKTFVDVSEKYGTHIPFAGYACICFIGLLLMEMVPETAGRTLEEIQDRLKGKKRGPDCTDVQDPLQVTKVPPLC